MKISDVCRCFCVNLQHRHDRWQRFLDVMQGLRWPFPAVERFPAVYGCRVQPPAWWSVGPGAWGCWLSHVRIWELAITHRWPAVLILEDDIEPTADFSERIEPTLAAVPDDWGQIFLGAAVLQDARFRAVNPFVRRIVGVNRTHGYITRLEMIEELYPFVFSLWSLADKESPRAYLQHIDHQMHHFHRQTSRRVYLAHPQLLGQCESYSDVLGMKVHYGQTG